MKPITALISWRPNCTPSTGSIDIRKRRIKDTDTALIRCNGSTESRAAWLTKVWWVDQNNKFVKWLHHTAIIPRNKTKKWWVQNSQLWPLGIYSRISMLCAFAEKLNDFHSESLTCIWWEIRNISIFSSVNKSIWIHGRHEKKRVRSFSRAKFQSERNCRHILFHDYKVPVRKV